MTKLSEEIVGNVKLTLYYHKEHEFFEGKFSIWLMIGTFRKKVSQFYIKKNAEREFKQILYAMNV